MSCSKRQKQFENGQKTDRISDLPETLLCHILSFVPTKSAVATSVLSRRWISVWTKVPVLDFTEFPISVSFSDRAKVSYNTFIKKVVLNNDMQSLQRFHFEVLAGSDMLCVSSLISSVLKREISEIYLTNQQVAANPNDVPLLLSVGLFYSERLKVLKLLGPFKISVLSNLHLPRVKTLYLHQLEFVGHDVLEILTSGCPALKEMVIEYCKGLKKLYIDSLTLDRLKIDRLETTNTRKMMVDVKVPNVSFLDLDFDVSFGEIEYDVSDLSSIVEARISICSGEASKQPWALELIRRISHAQRLWLSESTADLFAQVSENDLPMFPNLTVLEIQIAHSMFQMLKFAPKLRHLIVDVGRSIEESQPFPPDIVPHCLSSLPIVGIRDFEGLEHDSELVKYILKNAKVLEELKIHMHEASINQERDAYKKLLSFPRVSSTCQVITCSSCGDNAP